ncbi:MAG TPA: bifunctional riboflavin kinase/FAD synthetase [Candidatus Polarisedimenticolia bacterium]|nr:bifunctional riboflavin kinase/FAD synthetase [Candidatus Polarisedimenticolia bacterium]
MIVETRPEVLRPRLSNPVATIGNFDGVHRGHQAIFARVLERAGALGGTSVAITFDPHPLKVLAPGRAPDLIATPRQKLAFIEAAGIDAVLNLRFDAALADTGAEEFVDAYLRDALALREVYVGATFNFGRGREGTADTLVALCAARGITAGKVGEVRFLGSPVSSSRIRRAVRAGEVELAAELLGRPFAVEGTVRHGAGRGAGLGFPTANLEARSELVPGDGVYVTRTRAGDSVLSSVTNIGSRPTFADQDFAVETHLLDAQLDLYDSEIEVSFLARLRQELRFASAQALVEQVHRDVERARAWFAAEAGR